MDQHINPFTRITQLFCEGKPCLVAASDIVPESYFDPDKPDEWITVQGHGFNPSKPRRYWVKKDLVIMFNRATTMPDIRNALYKKRYRDVYYLQAYVTRSQINTYRYANMPILHYVAKTGYLPLFDLIISRCTDSTITTSYSRDTHRNLVHLLVQQNQALLLEYMMKHKRDLTIKMIMSDDPPIGLITSDTDNYIVQTVIENLSTNRLGSMASQYRFEASDYIGSILHYAVSIKSIFFVKVLASNRELVSILSEKHTHHTALQLAITGGNRDIVQTIYDAFDVNYYEGSSSNSSDGSPLRLALDSCREDLVQILLSDTHKALIFMSASDITLKDLAFLCSDQKQPSHH